MNNIVRKFDLVQSEEGLFSVYATTGDKRLLVGSMFQEGDGEWSFEIYGEEYFEDHGESMVGFYDPAVYFIGTFAECCGRLKQWATTGS